MSSGTWIDEGGGYGSWYHPDAVIVDPYYPPEVDIHVPVAGNPGQVTVTAPSGSYSSPNTSPEYLEPETTHYVGPTYTPQWAEEGDQDYVPPNDGPGYTPDWHETGDNDYSPAGDTPPRYLGPFVDPGSGEFDETGYRADTGLPALSGFSIPPIAFAIAALVLVKG